MAELKPLFYVYVVGGKLHSGGVAPSDFRIGAVAISWKIELVDYRAITKYRKEISEDIAVVG